MPTLLPDLAVLEEKLNLVWSTRPRFFSLTSKPAQEQEFLTTTYRNIDSVVALCERLAKTYDDPHDHFKDLGICARNIAKSQRFNPARKVNYVTKALQGMFAHIKKLKQQR